MLLRVLTTVAAELECSNDSSILEGFVNVCYRLTGHTLEHHYVDPFPVTIIHGATLLHRYQTQGYARFAHGRKRVVYWAQWVITLFEVAIGVAGAC